LRGLLERTSQLIAGEPESEVCIRENVYGLQQALGLNSMNGLIIGGIITGDCTTQISLLMQLRAEMSAKSGKRSIPSFRSAQIGST